MYALARFRLPEAHTIPPNISDNFRYITIRFYSLQNYRCILAIKTILIPFEVGKAQKILLEQSKKIIYYCGDFLMYGVYVEQENLKRFVEGYLREISRGDQKILDDYRLEFPLDSS